MRQLGAALAACLYAPWTYLRLCLILWLGLLLPVLLGFTLPLYSSLEDTVASHPDARLLIGASQDTEGFAYAFGADFTRNQFTDAQDRFFWLLACGWVLVTFLSGGVVARLVRRHERRPFLFECGIWCGRFLRLGILAAFVIYLADLVVNFVWADSLEKEARHWHTESTQIRGLLLRGGVFLVVWYLFQMLHAYAKIDLVARDGRSSLTAYLRAIGAFFGRIHRLVPLELGLVLLQTLLALVGFFVVLTLRPDSPDAGWPTIGLFLAAWTLYSFLRSGVSVGVMVARCRVLVPEAAVSERGPVMPPPVPRPTARRPSRTINLAPEPSPPAPGPGLELPSTPLAPGQPSQEPPPPVIQRPVELAPDRPLTLPPEEREDALDAILGGDAVDEPEEPLDEARRRQGEQDEEEEDSL